MDIPFRRIVGLIALGLVAGALLRLIHRALQEMKSWPGALRGGALATFEVEGERFRAWTTNPKTIHDLHELQQGTSTANIPNGRILRGPGQAKHNAPYHWHLDPQDITMDEVVERVGRYCPWAARLVELKDFTSRVGQQFSVLGAER